MRIAKSDYRAASLEAGTTRGVLHLVSAPIGNVEDITLRALRTLREADLLIVEDAQIVRALLRQHGVTPPDIVSLRPRRAAPALQAMQSALQNGKKVALLCDAGTPGVADPGLAFVRAALQAGAAVTTLPGPCAAIAALSVSGLPARRFVFEGFPPTDRADRAAFFLVLGEETRTLVLYETPARLVSTLAELCRVCGPARPAALACDLTRPTERIERSPLAMLRESAQANPPQGEIVLIIGELPKKRVVLPGENPL